MNVKYKLKNIYNLSETEVLYIKMIEVIQDDMNIPKTEYDIYSKINGTNLEKLDKSICKDVKVSLFIPINITESLDKLNISSNYYNDICYTATSDK